MSATNSPILNQYTEILSEEITFSMIEISGGRFGMGDNKGEYSIFSPKPAHQVELSTFMLGQYPVTQVLWQAVMEDTPSHFKGPNRPVERVSWDDTQVFLEKLNDQLGLFGERMYRLPTEAEWEYAARGGIYSNRYNFAGSNQLERVGWYSENSQGQTHPVGLLLPNELGLYDMSGNVWEWCQDWYDSDYYQQCHEKRIVYNPTGSESGLNRVLRGGSWDGLASFCRVALRSHVFPHSRYAFGLRLSRTAL